MDELLWDARTPCGAPRLLAGVRPWLLGVALALSWMPAAVAQDSRDIAVTVHREGEEVVVDVDFLVNATPQEAWNVLTDYDHMSQFVADLRRAGSCGATATASRWRSRAASASGSSSSRSRTCARSSWCHCAKSARSW